MSQLPKNQDPNLLVGFDTSDDAGVYRLTDDIAIITTADFITPPVDDPFLFGQISAANAISDVYAMGGKPITCLNLACFPSKKLAPEILHGIISGALDKITEAGAVLAGGHTIEDEEPKFGLSVTGIVHPAKLWKNVGAKPDDVLILTKPIGSGVIFNANLKKAVSKQALDECLDIITTLNKTAAEIMTGFQINAVTDVTGFGLAGHSLEMAKGSNVTFEINTNELPVMKEALEMYKNGITTGVNQFNRELVEDYVEFANNLSACHKEILFDPQTSGGLLVSLPEKQGKELLSKLHDAGVNSARMIGKVSSAKKDVYLVFS